MGIDGLAIVYLPFVINLFDYSKWPKKCFSSSRGLSYGNTFSSLLFTIFIGKNISCLANILSYKVDSLLLNYFDLLLGAAFKAKLIWEVVLKKISKRLKSWMKWIRLSKDGRWTLIKITLSNFPFYFLFLFPLLVDVVSHIENFCL